MVFAYAEYNTRHNGVDITIFEGDIPHIDAEDFFRTLVIRQIAELSPIVYQ